MPGVHSVRRRLATGETVTYHYAWRGKGAPRLPGKPGSPEFLVALAAALAEPPAQAQGTLQAVIGAYQRSTAYTGLAEATRRGYARRIPAIERAFGDMPIKILADPRASGVFLEWRDKLAQNSPREADYHMAVLGLILAWGLKRGMVPANPAAKPGRVYRADRIDAVWTVADETAFLETAPPHLRLPFLLGLHTGQREGDILRLTWAAYDGTHIRLRQSKKGRRVVVPVTAALKQELDRTRRKAVTICATSRGTSWTVGGFSASWRKALAAAGLTGLTFHDLRGTAVTRLAIAGCTVPEIASITGHSLKAVDDILDRHYLSRSQALSDRAIAKVERNAP